MNVGSPREESKPASTNAPAPSVGEGVPALPKYEKDDLSNDDDNDGDLKLSPKTTHIAKDAVVEPSEKSASAGKGKKKRTWKKPEVSRQWHWHTPRLPDQSSCGYFCPYD